MCLHLPACATPTCSDAVLTSTCLFSFAANPTWLSSPGREHSTPFFCCLSRLPLVPAVNHLSPSLQNFTDTGQERKQPLGGKKATKPTRLFFRKICRNFPCFPPSNHRDGLLLHPALRYFFWDLLHQGSGFLICKQLHLVFGEQLEWSCSYLHAEESIGSFCVAVSEEELGIKRDLEAE